MVVMDSESKTDASRWTLSVAGLSKVGNLAVSVVGLEAVDIPRLLLRVQWVLPDLTHFLPGQVEEVSVAVSEVDSKTEEAVVDSEVAFQIEAVMVAAAAAVVAEVV